MNREWNEGALSGYRVLDLTDDKGMLCSRLLADFGAEVIKVQPLMPEAEDKFSWGYY